MAAALRRQDDRALAGAAVAPRKYDLADPSSPSWRSHRKHLFVLSSAGKPIFSRFGDESRLAGLTGVLQALVSFVAGNDDEIRHVRAGKHTIVFLVRGPLYLVAASSCGDTVPYLRRQLGFLHAQLISILTSKVEDVFARNASFDLRSLLGGTDRVLRTLIRQASSAPAMLLGAVPAIRAPPALRAEVSRLLLVSRPAALLFALVVSRGCLLTMLRSRKAALRPADTLLVMNALASASEAASSGAGQFREDESWLPICLPHHDPRGFVFAHVSFVAEELCLVLLSPDREAFPALSEYRARVASALEPHAPSLGHAVAAALPALDEAGVPEVLHYVYVLHAAGQYIAPALPQDSPYARRDAFKRLLRRYQLAHARTRPAAPGGKPTREYVQGSDSELLLAWCTLEFELYVSLRPLTMLPVRLLTLLPRRLVSALRPTRPYARPARPQAAAAACKELLRWLRKEERSFFLLNTKY